MNHNRDTMTNLGLHSRHGITVWQCRECGAKIVGENPAGQCRIADPEIVGPHTGPLVQTEPLDCIHRLEKVGTVPCGTCRATNKTIYAAVYLCKAEGGRACTLRPVGNGPDQHVHGALPVVCITCELRKPLTKG